MYVVPIVIMAHQVVLNKKLFRELMMTKTITYRLTYSKKYYIIEV